MKATPAARDQKPALMSNGTSIVSEELSHLPTRAPGASCPAPKADRFALINGMQRMI